MEQSTMIICEASDLAGQLTALVELLYERGTGSGLPANDPVLGLAYNLSAKVHFFLRAEEERQESEELNRAKHN